MNGCFNSVIVEYRSLYESFVIGQYLVQNPDLVPVYKDHLQFLKYHLTQLVGNSKPEWDKIHDDYLNKYGQEFAENYGWTKSKIPNKKDRKIGTLVKACNLEKSFTILYKFAYGLHRHAFKIYMVRASHCVRDCRGGVAVLGLSENEAIAKPRKARPRISGVTPKF